MLQLKPNISTVRKYVVFLGIITATFFATAWSQYTTEDLLSNASFDLEDNLGLPVDWGVRTDIGATAEVVEDDKKDGEGALRIIVNEELSKDFMATQNILNKTAPELAGQTLKCKAWVKTSTNLGFQFQLVVHQGRRNPSAPFWEGGPWSTWASAADIAPGEWTLVESDVSLRDNQNAFIFRVFINKQAFPGCTVWVDGIELTIGEVSVTNKALLPKQSGMLSINGNKVKFDRPANYRLRVFTPNGKQYFSRVGNGKVFDLLHANLPVGYYILKVKSDIGDATKPFVVRSR